MGCFFDAEELGMNPCLAQIFKFQPQYLVKGQKKFLWTALKERIHLENWLYGDG